MKKSILIAIVLFLVSTVLYNILNVIINEQILSRILFGTDYNTYIMNYYSGQDGFIKLISGNKMHYEWVFKLSRYILVIACIFIMVMVIKRIAKNNKLEKKEFIISMSIFSILSLYNVFLYLYMFKSIPPINHWWLPIVFIISVYIGMYAKMYVKKEV